MKTPYATTPMRVTLGRAHKSEDNEEEELVVSIEAGEQTLLQQLEDSVGHLRGELGVCSPNSRYITLHGGVGALGNDYVRLQEGLQRLGQELSAAALHAKDAREEACQAWSEATALGVELEALQRLGGSRELASLRQELTEAKGDQGALEDTVLALAAAVTGLMETGTHVTQPGQNNKEWEDRLTAHAAAISGRLDSIRQEMKGGGITVGGVTFSGQEAAMDWARIHLPPNTYQCIGGMVYAMCLILEAVVHQEDMMKREEHGERVKRTFMQSAKVLSVHTAYPPVLDGVKALKQDGLVDFLELKTYKQWKPTDGEGTRKKL